MRFNDPPPRSGGGEKFLQLAVAALQFVLIGMLLYLRFGPYRRVEAAMAARGAEVPGWLSWGFTLGVAALVVFLGIRGLIAVRRFLRIRRPGP
jgi:hypothetical protein